MKEVSLFIKDRINLTPQEFRTLNRYTVQGRFWQVHEYNDSICRIIRQEFIFDEHAFLTFRLMSSNIYIWWPTDFTKSLVKNQSYKINERITIHALD